MVIKKTLASFLLLSAFSGCAFFSTTNKPLSEDPLTFQILEERYQEGLFSIATSVVAPERWDLRHAAFQLTTYANGEVIETKVFPLSTLAGVNELKGGKPLSITLETILPRVTDYQLGILWGREADEALRERSQIELSEVEVERSEVECLSAPCPLRYALQAKVVNPGQLTVEDPSLGVFWIGEKGVGKEEELSLKGLTLASGESKPIRLVFSRLLDPSEEGVYPRVRVLPSKSVRGSASSHNS